jgi:hypothetical protein
MPKIAMLALLCAAGCPGGEKDTGSPGLGAPWFELAGDPDDGLGETLATVGDIDGDGLSELVVGASGAGHVYVFFARTLARGGTLGPSDADVVITADDGGIVGAVFGDAGDVDGDGLGDLVVQTSDPTFRDPGEVAVFFGSALAAAGSFATSAAGVRIPLDTADDILAGDTPPLQLGAGDVDGDGLSDLLFGDATAGQATSVGGAAWVFRGETIRAGGDFDPLDADATLVGAHSGAFFGYDVGCGDFDGDGRADAAVLGLRGGADLASDIELFSADAALASTTPSPAVADGTIRIGGYAYFGALQAGDVDGDGRDDLLWGFPRYHDSADTGIPDTGYGPTAMRGRVAVFSGALVGGGGAWTTRDRTAEVVGDDTTDLGFALAPPADVDGDGVPDVITMGENRFYVVSGAVLTASASVPSSASYIAMDLPGIASVAAADFSGDGRADPAVGVRDLGGVGRVTVFRAP